MTTITAHVWNSSQTTYKGELTEANQLRWRDVAGDMGLGSLFIGRNEPYLDTKTLAIRDVIRFDVDSTPAFAWRVEQIVKHHIAPGEEGVEGWEVSGRGTMCVLEEAVVYPANGEGWSDAVFTDQRVWNFASSELPEATWGATVFAIEKATIGVNYGLVELFIDPDAYWIWDRDQPGGIGINNAPAGTCYFRTTFTKAADGQVEVWGAADDSFELWIDGVEILRDDGYYRGNVRRARFDLNAGSHKIAIRGTNQNAAKAGVLATVIEVDAAGLYGSVIARTDTTWKALSYPASAPGFEPGRIIRVLFDEAINQRSGLTGVGAGFGDAVDRAGVAWPTLSEFSAPIGASVYSVVRQLAETFMDVRMRPTDLTLDGWVKDTAGSVLSVLFENHLNNPDIDNLRSLVHEITNVGSVQ